MINTKNICLLIAIFIFTSFSGVTCADATNSVAVQTLYAGQHIEAGTVNVSNDSEYIYISFETTDEWVILETHLEVANSSAAIPTTKSGNAIPGQFTYKNISQPNGITIDEYQISLETYLPLENDTLYIAAHAVVSNGESEEGAWANGTEFNENNWATYFTYKTSESEEDNTGGIAQEDDGTGDDGTGDDGTGDDGTGDDGTGDDGTGDDGTGDDGTGDDGTGDDGTGDDGTGDDGTGDDGTGDDGTGDDGIGDDGTGDDGIGDDGTGDDGTGDDGTGDDGTGDDGTGDDGIGDDGTGDDGTGDDGTGDDGTGDDGTGDDGTGDDGPVDDKPKSRSGGASFSGRYITGTESSDEDNRMFSTPDIEEEAEPEMSTPEPVPVPVEQEPVISTRNMLKNSLWYIIWLLLSAICVMSGYGLTQP
ncbi:hypothetical protein [uncultured Methanolobus sp.]|uniref:hypothetical protein n=1 Tax=uncultured Methanolobus sp. TaxID=218300 RepID=UPI0029C7E9F6|nr:hypothetical protein [uncultured Methanolobus sp.]